MEQTEQENVWGQEMCEGLWTGLAALHPFQMSEKELKVNCGLSNHSVRVQESKEIIQELYRLEALTAWWSPLWITIRAATVVAVLQLLQPHFSMWMFLCVVVGSDHYF